MKKNNNAKRVKKNNKKKKNRKKQRKSEKKKKKTKKNYRSLYLLLRIIYRISGINLTHQEHTCGRKSWKVLLNHRNFTALESF